MGPLLLYRADEIDSRDELPDLGPVVNAGVVNGEVVITANVLNSRRTVVRFAPDTPVLARKPQPIEGSPSIAQQSRSRPGSLSPVVMPPFTGGRLVGDPLAGLP